MAVFQHRRTKTLLGLGRADAVVGSRRAEIKAATMRVEAVG